VVYFPHPYTEELQGEMVMSDAQPFFIHLLNATIEDADAYTTFQREVVTPWLYRNRTVPHVVTGAGEAQELGYSDDVREELQTAQKVIVATVYLLKQRADITDADADVLQEYLRYLNVRAGEAIWHHESSLQRGVLGDPTIGAWTYNDVVCYAAQDFMEYIIQDDPRASWILRCDRPGCGRWFIPVRRRPAEHHFCSENCRRRYQRKR